MKHVMITSSHLYQLIYPKKSIIKDKSIYSSNTVNSIIKVDVTILHRQVNITPNTNPVSNFFILYKVIYQLLYAVKLIHVLFCI
nr:MAG TPA_asm: hypothetical protein [Caudoviricetes sp.]